MRKRHVYATVAFRKAALVEIHRHVEFIEKLSQTTLSNAIVRICEPQSESVSMQESRRATPKTIFCWTGISREGEAPAEPRSRFTHRPNGSAGASPSKWQASRKNSLFSEQEIVHGVVLLGFCAGGHPSPISQTPSSRSRTSVFRQSAPMVPVFRRTSCCCHSHNQNCPATTLASVRSAVRLISVRWISSEDDRHLERLSARR